VVSRFLEMYYLKVRYEGEDKICWILSRRKSFEVKFFYQVLSTPVQLTFTWMSIWKVKAPLRVSFLV